jgi:hypothetical protein
MITTGTMNTRGKETFRTFDIDGAKILARISFDEQGPGFFIEGYDASGRYRATDPIRLEEANEPSFEYFVEVLAKLTAKRAFDVFMHGGRADAPEGNPDEEE